MQLSDPKILFTGLQAFLFCTLLVKLYRCGREKQSLHKQLKDNSTQLQKVQKKNKDLTFQLAQLKDFQKNLKEAELTTRFQGPRLHSATQKCAPDAPDRYQYIRSLDEKGMSAEEISTVLKISSHETRQILTLARIAQKNQ